ncbi:PDR/VanB family oxidoreductase [Metapseudomonas resinovorans]|uniref:Putative oxygenase electron transfer component n=1 Tax=Metapseudomonas resinovorans NBRC 106553 TaxID=1245471 RepID=S6AGP6_METRE|nr:PDR/VanB family oxidoreductase [Pseudomonas resinovorans]BAN47300.1 putative oxygenase electron transfer component [Pseudomonas resinovorans NBRC 106553]
MTLTNTLTAFVHTLRFEAEGIISVELRPQGDQEFPSFGAGSHIDLHLGNGLVRSYSLLNSPEDRDRYVVGILRDRNSRGGSAYVHQNLRVGMQLQISPPRNLFQLDEAAGHTVLVAGGIGVTPIYCMFNRLRALGRSVEMLYCARTRKEAAFVEELAAIDGNIRLHFDDEKGGPVDLKAFLAERPSSAHFYCCGPTPMIDAFESLCESLGHPNVHIERFAAAAPAPTAPQGTYEVQLARSGKRIEVPGGKSLLDALLESGIEVDCSCREGVCGACETRVLEGEPEHRDGVLTKAEKAANQTMMVCVSGCKGARLVLDL